MRLLHLVPLALLTACSTTPPEQASLESALTTWSEAPDSYTFEWQRSCECSTAATRRIRITVTDNAITSAVYVDNDGGPVDSEIRSTLLTIDGVFAKIQDAIDEDAHAVAVTYDPTLGNPTSIGVDYDQHVADEEWSLQISNVALAR